MSSTWRVRLKTIFAFLFACAVILIVGPPTPSPGDEINRIRAYTRANEFDFGGWISDALWLKIKQSALGVSSHLDQTAQHELVLIYLVEIAGIKAKERQLEEIYADPTIADPDLASVDLQAELAAHYKQRALIAPLAEQILQNMLSTLLAEEGFTLAGQAVPPVLYHSTPLPWALIISPRDHIEQKTSISLAVDLNVVDHVALETAIEAAFPELSALVVPIGGLGAYPTMVLETTNFNWQSTVIAHEWIHNYLTLRPLGVLYGETPELRTMNETTASIAGDELGALLLARYFPERVPPPPPPIEPATEPQPTPEPEPPAFDFRAEMRTTRNEVDALLAEGEIEAAETYMETRRQLFLQNGYQIRRINQAYFAFYGAYADTPGGAAGEDPVGGAVRDLRAESPTLADFVNQMAWLTSYEDLRQLINK